MCLSPLPCVLSAMTPGAKRRAGTSAHVGRARRLRSCDGRGDRQWCTGPLNGTRPRTRGTRPVTRNSVCSPMSTALSPIRSMHRATTIIRMPHSCVPGALSISSTLSTTRRFVRSISSSRSTSDRARLDVARGERVERDAAPSPPRDRPSPEPLDEIVVLLELGRELRQLRDRDAWSPMRSRWIELWSTARTRRRSVATGDCWASNSLDRLLDAVVARVDLVVEGDDLVAELDVLRLERVDGARTARRTTAPCSWRLGLERVEARLELDPRHANRTGR